MFEVISWIIFFCPLILYYFLTKGSVSLLGNISSSFRSLYQILFFSHNQSEKQLAFPQSLNYVFLELTKLLEELMTHMQSFPYSKKNWMCLKTTSNLPCYHKYCFPNSAEVTLFSHLLWPALTSVPISSNKAHSIGFLSKDWTDIEVVS